MAKGKKTGGRNWALGQSGNPVGTPVVPDDLKAARKLNRIELERVLNRYIYMTKAEIVRAAQSEDTPAMELMIASLISKGTNEGDPKRLGFIFEYLGFVVTKKIDMNANHNSTFKIEFTEEQRRKIARAYLDDDE